MNPMAKRLAATCVIVFATGCVRDEASAGAAASSPDPVGVWNVDDAAIAQAGKPAYLEFRQDGQMGGNAGCNSFGATYTLGTDGAIAISTLRQTKMFCGGAAMETEKRMIDALSRAARIETAGTRLTLRDASGAALLSFERAP